MNSVRSNNINLKYQRFTTLGSKDIGIIKSEFVAKTQFFLFFIFLLTSFLPFLLLFPLYFSLLLMHQVYAGIFPFMYYLRQVNLHSTFYIYLSSWNIFIMYSPSIRSSIIFYLYTPSPPPFKYSLPHSLLFHLLPPSPHVWCGVLVSKYLLLPSDWNFKLEAPRPSFIFISTWIFFIELNWINKVFLYGLTNPYWGGLVWFFLIKKN